MDEEALSLLRAMPVFGGLEDRVLELLVTGASPVSREPHDYFLREGDPAESMFVLLSGKVAVLKTWHGKEYLLRTYGRGDCFGEMSLLDLGPRSASVRAVESARALEIDTGAIHRIYEMDAAQFALLHMNMGREVSRRLRAANDLLFQARLEAGPVDGEIRLP